MLVRDYSHPDRSGYGSIWEVVDVQLKLDGVMDFLKEGLFQVELSNDEILRTLTLPASMPGFEILHGMPPQRHTSVPVANAAAYVGYPLFTDGLAEIAREAGAVGVPTGYPILTEVRFRTNWQTGYRWYYIALEAEDTLGYGYDVSEQDAQVLKLYPADYPANRYVPSLIGRTNKQ
jgi:hypothetical protein